MAENKGKEIMPSPHRSTRRALVHVSCLNEKKSTFSGNLQKLNILLLHSTKQEEYIIWSQEIVNHQAG